MKTTDNNARTTALFEAAEAKFGFVPNVLQEMSASPAALEIYMQTQGSLAHPESRLSDRERNLVQLAVSQHFGCGYCVAAHTAVGKGAGSAPEALAAVAKGQAVSEEEGGLFVDAVRLLLAKEGHLSGADLAQLEAVGIDKEVLFEMIANISVKLLSNWVNHIAGTEVDVAFTG